MVFAFLNTNLQISNALRGNVILKDIVEVVFANIEVCAYPY